MALTKKEKIKARVSVVATGFLTLAIAFAGSNAGRENVLPWAIAFFALYAIELPYLTFNALKDVKEPSVEEERKRTLAKRREQAQVHNL